MMTASGTSPTRKRDADKTRGNILEIAIKEFSESGYSGARIDVIADKTRTSKRMLYYYFGDKEGLFVAALEKAYADVRSKEKALDLEGLTPVEALKTLVRFTFDHHDAHPEFIRLVMVANIHDAEHIRQSTRIRDINLGAISLLRRIVERGVADGSFTSNINPLALHWHISALSFFHVSNRPSFSVLFGEDFSSLGTARLREQSVASVLSVIGVTAAEGSSMEPKP